MIKKEIEIAKAEHREMELVYELMERSTAYLITLQALINQATQKVNTQEMPNFEVASLAQMFSEILSWHHAVTLELLLEVKPELKTDSLIPTTLN